MTKAELIKQNKDTTLTIALLSSVDALWFYWMCSFSHWMTIPFLVFLWTIIGQFRDQKEALKSNIKEEITTVESKQEKLIV